MSKWTPLKALITIKPVYLLSSCVILKRKNVNLGSLGWFKIFIRRGHLRSNVTGLRHRGSKKKRKLQKSAQKNKHSYSPLHRGSLHNLASDIECVIKTVDKKNSAKHAKFDLATILNTGVMKFDACVIVLLRSWRVVWGKLARGDWRMRSYRNRDRSTGMQWVILLIKARKSVLFEQKSSRVAVRWQNNYFWSNLNDIERVKNDPYPLPEGIFLNQLIEKWRHR